MSTTTATGPRPPCGQGACLKLGQGFSTGRWMAERVTPEAPQRFGLGLHQFGRRPPFPGAEVHLPQVFVRLERDGTAAREFSGEVSAAPEGRGDDPVPASVVADGRPHLRPAFGR
jgi:hypothetical protein